MKHPLAKERGRKFVGLPEFVQAGERILSELDLEQERGTVTNVPDERTVRYYLSEGLIQAPEEKQGTASVFGYLNLLQLVAIKKLQADHLPIRKIREVVAGKSEQDLERLLGIADHSADGVAVYGKKGRESEAKRYLESLLTSSRDESFGSSLIAGHSSITSPPAASPRQKQMSTASAPALDSQAEDESPSWQRLEIEPGLELHIRSDYAPPTTSARTRSLADRIRGVISRWRAKDL